MPVAASLVSELLAADEAGVRVRAWEFAAAVLGFLIALLYALTGTPVLALGIAGGVAAGLAARMRPIELPGVAAGHVRRQGQLEAAKLLSLVAVQLAALALVVTAALGGWSHDPEGRVAVLALFGLSTMLLIELNRRGDIVLDYLVGADSEKAVSKELEQLPPEWFVTHNWKKEYGGNIDHIAIGPTGVFAVETKSGSYRAAAGAQAVGAALELRALTGIGWVTAVVCVPDGDQPVKKGNVWVVPRRQLADWLQTSREYRGGQIDVAAASATFAA